ncbi:MAG: hypothetical protein HY660_06325, partial [Armatimonadetes bacterium]|nr:hypothetical protein [Armatimonadota bacterium]
MTGDGVRALVIDLGTTCCKVALLAETGRIEALAAEPYARAAPEAGSEDPEDWWETVRRGVSRIDAGRAGIAGIGLAGRGGGMALLDAAGRVIALPSAARAAMTAAARAPLLPAMRRQLKLVRWGRALEGLKAHDPKLFARARRVLGVKDFVAFRMTGEQAIDPASADGWRWSPAVLRRLSVSPDLFPPIRPGWEILGTLRPRPAAELGLPAGLPAVVGGHDGCCANLGAGMIRPGQGCLTLGTVGVVRAVTERPHFGSREFSTLAYPLFGRRWACGGDVASGGRALQWFARLCHGRDGVDAALL